MDLLQKNLKILELCPYSAGGCGVWARVKQESLELVKRGYEVTVFSSNFEKGTNKIMASSEVLEGIKIKRFSAKKLGGESFMHFNFEKEALKYKPDIIFAHNYRHLHTTKALKIRNKLEKIGKKSKVFLVTHAPFVEGNITRTYLQTLIVKIYDSLVGPLTLNKFDKILVISHWEIPYLLKCGAKKDKIVYIPNGIPHEFFTQEKAKEENKILFLGRIAVKKRLETLIGAAKLTKNKPVIEIVGPKEEEYYEKLKRIISELGVKNVIFSDPVYGLKEKIRKIDSCKVFVLPSRVEGMPQSLIEAMARRKIVIGSDSIAIRDLIQDKKNGYLFEFDNSQDLAHKIDLALENNKANEKIRHNASKFVEKFRWDKVINRIESLF